MSFDKHWDEKELMLKGLLNHPYKDLGKFKEDLITYMNYKYDEENLAFEWARHSEYGDAIDQLNIIKRIVCNTSKRILGMIWKI